ncbi:hypothetical protein CR513_56079, partial [Mucuna pruriens]
MEGMSRSRRRRYVQQNSGGHLEDRIISFTEANYEDVQPHQDDPMVISVVTVDYKVERVLVDQGSSANKLGLMEEELEACLGTLIGFAGEQVDQQMTHRCYGASLKIRSRRADLEEARTSS